MSVVTVAPIANMHQWTQEETDGTEPPVEPQGEKRNREPDEVAKEKGLPAKKRHRKGVAKPTGDNGFRLSGKQLFLTYPQCGDLTKEDALLQLSDKLGEPEEYLIATEKHEVGEHSGPVGLLSEKDYVQWTETRLHYLHWLPADFPLY